MSNSKLIVLKGSINKANADYLVLKAPCFISTQNKTAEPNCRLSVNNLFNFDSLKICKGKGRRQSTEKIKVTFL